MSSKERIERVCKQCGDRRMVTKEGGYRAQLCAACARKQWGRWSLKR